MFTNNKGLCFSLQSFLIRFLFLLRSKFDSLPPFPSCPPCFPFLCFHPFPPSLRPLISAFSQVCLFKNCLNEMSWFLVPEVMRFVVTLILLNNEFRALVLVPRKFLLRSFILGNDSFTNPKRMSYSIVPELISIGVLVSKDQCRDEDLFFDPGTESGGLLNTYSLVMWVHHGKHRGATRFCMMGVPFPGRCLVM